MQSHIDATVSDRVLLVNTYRNHISMPRSYSHITYRNPMS
ncbi:hypothetical protein F383_25418 [Gossypium arboreum]|uniref:Uncharacterized protein n=1 Tax=Gossypium arboreum TaxID=29729 RepID=A0A0B0ML87_GOSAR|nr:hypothetical protein F383_25418 [Gossypium arboreum]